MAHINILSNTMATTVTSSTPYNISPTDYVLSDSSNTNWDTLTISASTNHNTLAVRGDASFDGDVIIKGKNIADSLERIEERLAILHPNEELEAKWENLRGLRKAYMELEAEIKEKEKVWGILKK